MSDLGLSDPEFNALVVPCALFRESGLSGWFLRLKPTVVLRKVATANSKFNVVVVIRPYVVDEVQDALDFREPNPYE